MPQAAAVKAGAITSACLLTAAIAIPTIVSVFVSQHAASWAITMVVFSVPWIAVAALLGAIAGRMVVLASDAVGGAIVGVILSVLVSLSYSALFVTMQEEQQVHTCTRLLFFGSSIGAVTGWVAWRAGNRLPDRVVNQAFQISLSDVALLIAAIAAHLTAYVI